MTEPASVQAVLYFKVQIGSGQRAKKWGVAGAAIFFFSVPLPWGGTNEQKNFIPCGPIGSTLCMAFHRARASAMNAPLRACSDKKSLTVEVKSIPNEGKFLEASKGALKCYFVEHAGKLCQAVGTRLFQIRLRCVCTVDCAISSCLAA
jgi:hypothetical protein